MLQQPQAPLHDHILQHRSRRHVDGVALSSHDDDRALEDHPASKVNRPRNGQMIQLEDLRDRRDTFLEGRNLFEVRPKFDQGCGTEAIGIHDELAMLESVKVGFHQHEIGAGFDGQEASTRDIDTMSVVEVTDGGTDGGFELDNGNVGFSLFVGRDGFIVGDDFHFELLFLDHTFDSFEVDPDVVGIEVLEFLDRLELVDVLFGDLGNFEESDGTVVVDDGATFDISFGFVC